MPSNKKHHFVPKFYLKHFSSNGKSINLYNIPSNKLIANANLKYQCYRDYFYGQEDGMEKALGTIEGAASKVIKQIIEEKSIPSRYSENHMTLLIFILIQQRRTTYAAAQMNEMTNNLLKRLMLTNIKLKEDTTFKEEDLDTFKIEMNDPAMMSVGVVCSTWHLASDLRYKLIVCKQGCEFIASDNPAVLYNQMFESTSNSGEIGLASKGLEIFLPISPSLLIMFYDEKCYKVGSKNSNVIFIQDHKDVDSLNRLQIVSASENIYYGNATLARLSILKSSTRQRNPDKTNFSAYPNWESEEKYSELLVSSQTTHQIKLALSFIKPLKHSISFIQSLSSAQSRPAVFIRNPQLVEADHRYQKYIESAKDEPMGFFTFTRMEDKN